MNVDDFLIFGLTPLVSLLFHYGLKKEKHKQVLFVLVLIISPLLFGYVIRIPFLNRLVVLLILAILFSYFLFSLDTNKSKIISSIVSVFMIFVVVILLSFPFGFLVSYEKSKVCENASHIVEKYVEKPFVGRHATDYILYNKKLFGIFKQKIQTVSDNPFDTTKNCLFFFDKENIFYDKCMWEIIIKK